MQDMLTQIERAILQDRYAFSGKAQTEMERDGFREFKVLEAILNATTIYKTLRAQSPSRKSVAERLYVIHGTNYDGLFIFTKGKWEPSKDSHDL